MKKRENVDIMLHCNRCSKDWKYTGKSDWYTACPRCHTTVNVRKKLIELGVIKDDKHMD